MFYVDEARCTGCGACIDVCAEGAITLREGKAVIDQELCIRCGICLELCVAGAICEVKVSAVALKATATTIPGGSPMAGKKQNGYELQSKEGGGSMPNGYGFGGGMGFGFRGGSPPWPYVGRGRGGLPRCRYPGAFTAPAYWPGSAPYPSYGGVWPVPFYGGHPAPGAAPYPPGMTREQELDFLKGQADAMKGQLDEIEARVRELEAKEG